MNFKHWKKLLLYIESPAMRGLLRRLKCNNYKILVAASIIRPGVAQSGMMKSIFFRHNHPISSNIFMKHSKNIWEKPMVLWCIRKM
jgi:DNA polymerase III alpha subunit